MAYVHSTCLSKWLETRLSLKCELCHFGIQQSLDLKGFRDIMKDLCKLFVKKLTRDKFLIFKVVIYSAYMVLSCKKAAACYRLLLDQLRNRNKSTTSQTLLCLLYLGLVLMQLFIFSTNEITYFYKVLKQQLRLVCYEITFKNKQTQTTPAELKSPGEED